MPTLVIENVPAPLFARIQQLAAEEKRTPAAVALDLLEAALDAAPSPTAAPLPDEPFLIEEIPAPFDIPWPEGTPVHAVEVSRPLPEPHDFPELE
jgi:hypothetical protein